MVPPPPPVGAQLRVNRLTDFLRVRQYLLIYGMIIAGDPMSASGHYGTACVGAPDADALENARKLGERVAQLVKKLA